MKALGLLLVAFLCLAHAAVAQGANKPISGEEVLKAIQVFSRSPQSEEGRLAASTITRYANASDDVAVSLTPEIVPWFGIPKPPKHSGTLLAAFIAGNVKSQVEKKTKGDDSHAGLQQVIKTYAQLKESDKSYSVPEVEKFVELESKGELKKYVEDAAKKDAAPPVKQPVKRPSK